MAEAILGPVIEEALFKVASFTAGQIRLAWGLEKELSKLRQSLNLIQPVLQDAEEKQQSEAAIQEWLHELKDVAYDIVEVLDDVAYEVLRYQVETQSQAKRVRTFFSPSNPIAFRFNMANKIKKINESLAKVRGDAVFPLLTRKKSPRVGQSRLDTYSYLDSKFESRRDEDVAEIVNLLIEQRSHQHPIAVISLIGMAGVGKTTLAKLLYREVEKRNMFDAVAWVCIFYDFDEQKILNGMFEDLDHNAGGIKSINVLLKQREEKLEKKTFLLVLDDVWNDNSNTWATFGRLFSKIVKTSRNFIVVTTFKDGVASSIAKLLPLHRHHLKKLLEDDCWLIIKEKVFGSTEASITDQKLEAIRRDIAKKCGGLPLIANVLGGTICNVKGVDGWLPVRDKIAWNLEDGD